MGDIGIARILTAGILRMATMVPGDQVGPGHVPRAVYAYPTDTAAYTLNTTGLHIMI